MGTPAPFRSHLHVPAAALLVADVLIRAGHVVLLVGGAVRDGLRDVGPAEIADIDLATDATPKRVCELVVGRPWLDGRWDVGERFGTVGLRVDDSIVEVSRFRAECATAGCAEPELLDRFAADAAHRDFTVNALAATIPDGAVLDPLGGRADLEAGVLRAPGEPAERFAEDPLRVLRLARFVSELGFEPEARTAAAAKDAAPRLAEVAAERIRAELDRLLLGDHPAAGLRTARDIGALALVLPEVAALDGMTQPSFHDLDGFEHTLMTVEAAPRELALRWAALLHDVGKPPTRSIEEDGRIRFFNHAQVGAELAHQIAERLRFSNADARRVVHLVRTHMRFGELDTENARAVDRAVRALDLWEEHADPPTRLVSAEEALDLTIADLSATAGRERAPEAAEILAEAIARSRERGTEQCVRSPISGRELMAQFDLAEGPGVGIAKGAIESAIAEGALAPDDREGALELARQALEEASVASSGVGIRSRSTANEAAPARTR
jgi:poly(A) polymerase